MKEIFPLDYDKIKEFFPLQIKEIMFRLYCSNKNEIETKPEELKWSIICCSSFGSRNYFLQGEKGRFKSTSYSYKAPDEIEILIRLIEKE